MTAYVRRRCIDFNLLNPITEVSYFKLVFLNYTYKLRLCAMYLQITVNFLAERRHGNSIEIVKDTTQKLKVSFSTSNAEQIDLSAIKNTILDLGLSLDRTRVSISKDKKQIAIDVSSFIKYDAFSHLGLRLSKTIFIIGSRTQKATQPVEGAYIQDVRYFI